MQSIVEKFIPITLANIERVEPNVLKHPYEQHPVFYGCLDWHSAVHSHWQLVRAVRRFPNANFAPTALALLEQQLGNYGGLQLETLTLERKPRYELPYGLAWLLKLCAELRDWGKYPAWIENLDPLERLASKRLVAYFEKLSHPIRSGLHYNSAFSLSLAWDWGKVTDDPDMLITIADVARAWFENDIAAPLAYEPSATDFLSPLLAEADLLRRVMGREEFLAWFGRFLPDHSQLPQPVRVVDPSDGQLAHFAGLNLSRAWMLAGLARVSPKGERRELLLQSAEAHSRAGLSYALSDEYMISHWIPTFALYLLTQFSQRDSDTKMTPNRPS